MTITSLEFTGFVLVVLGLYYLLPYKFQNYVLLISSYIFLLSWSFQFALIYFCLTAINYGLGRLIVEKPTHRRPALVSGIVFNMLIWSFLKHANFFIPSAIDALNRLGLRSGTETVTILLPLGLSFFIVQAISYLIDVNKGVVKPVNNPVIFAIYMVYFPHIVSGPIERARDFAPVLEKRRNINTRQVSDGLVLLLQGLVRKVVIADLLFIIIPVDLFTQPQKFSAPDLTLSLLAYAFAIYNDFAGYTLIVRAVSNFFGIPLSKNFDAPYFARSFSEFWRRWHITLSNWLRDYIFMPTMRFLLKRKYDPASFVCVVIPPMITMFVSALWHNVSLNMLLWGAMHGVYLVIERVINLNRHPKPNTATSYWRNIASIVLVFMLTLLTWVPFKADLSSTLNFWSRLISPSNWYIALFQPASISHTIGIVYTLDLVVLFGLSIFLDLAHIRFGEQGFKKLPIPLQAIVLNLVLLMLFVVEQVRSAPPPFIYQGF